MAGPRQAKETTDKALKGARVLIVEGRYYEDIADALLTGATQALDRAKVEWTVITVPGALEVPQAVVIALDSAQRRRRHRFDGVVALGCVIRGETSHYDIVAGESARALMDIATSRRIPVGNGILTVDTQAQALARARPEEHDKGGTAARAALALIRLQRSLGTGARR